MDGQENTKTPPTRRYGAICEARKLLWFGFWIEAECGGVDAVALARMGRSVREDVSLVGAADGAVYLSAAHEEAAILFRLDVCLVEWLPETRPARTGIVLGGRREEGRPAGHTAVDSLLFVGVVLTTEGPLCALHPRHAVLLRGELVLPLFFRLLYLPWRISHVESLPRRFPALEANNARLLFNPLLRVRPPIGVSEDTRVLVDGSKVEPPVIEARTPAGPRGSCEADDRCPATSAPRRPLFRPGARCGTRPLPAQRAGVWTYLPRLREPLQGVLLRPSSSRRAAEQR